MGRREERERRERLDQEEAVATSEAAT